MVYVSSVVASESPGSVALFVNGPTLDAYLAGPNAVYNPDGSLDIGASLALGSAVAVQAEIDTGSTISGADAALLQSVGAPVTLGAGVPVQTPSGNATDSTYTAALWIAGGRVNVWAATPGVLGEYLPSGPRALIGRDVLATGSLVYDGAAGAWTLVLPNAGAAQPTPALASGWEIGGALVVVGAVLAAMGSRPAGRRAA